MTSPTPDPAQVGPPIGHSPIRALLDRSFGIDLRSLAALRIALGLALLVDLADRARLFSALYTEAGLLPREWVRSRLCLHTLSPSPSFTGVLFILAGIVALLLILGYRTRLATALSWLLLLSLHKRNEFVIDGGDGLLALLLFWSMMLPLGARWSVDARGGPAPGKRRVLGVASAGILLQLCLMYLFTGLAKLGDSSWQQGTALFEALGVQAWVHPLGAWLADAPILAPLLTYVVLVTEIAFALLILVPAVRVRALCILGFLGLQLGFGLCIHLGLFPWISSIALIPFLPTEFWDRLERRRGGPERATLLRGHSGLERATQTFALLILGYQLIFNVGVLRKDHLLHGELFRVGDELRLNRVWSMFAPPPRFNHQLIIRGGRGEEQFVIDDGDDHTLAALAQLRSDYRSKTYLEHVELRQRQVAAAFASWICRAYASDPTAGTRLEYVEIAVWSWPSWTGRAGSRSGGQVLGRWSCVGTHPPPEGEDSRPRAD